MPEDSTAESTRDEIIVYTQTTVDRPPEQVTEEWLAKAFHTADYVEAHDRFSSDWLTSTGDEPASFICEECGEECHSGRTYNGMFYPRHSENTDCERDLTNKPSSSTSTSNSPRSPTKHLITAGSVFAVLVATSWLTAHTLPLVDLTINGEQATSLSRQTIFWTLTSMAAFFAAVIALLPYVPGIGGGRFA